MVHVPLDNDCSIRVYLLFVAVLKHKYFSIMQMLILMVSVTYYA